VVVGITIFLSWLAPSFGGGVFEGGIVLIWLVGAAVCALVSLASVAWLVVLFYDRRR
jgi:hypothetical protein